MTVAELIQRLQECDPAAVVVLAKDAEGNGYSPLEEIDAGVYTADTTWGGTFTNAGDVGAPPSLAPPAVCLWPVN